MFVAVWYSLYGVEVRIRLYGPFSTVGAAEAWIANQSDPQNYYVAAAWTPPTPNQTGSLTPATVTAGQYLAVAAYWRASGLFFPLAFGGFGSEAAGTTWALTATPEPKYYVRPIQAGS